MADQRGARQNEAPRQPTSNPRSSQSAHDPSQSRRGYAGGPSSDRYRPAPSNASPTAAARSMGGTGTYSGYYADTSANPFPTPQSTMGYHQPTADYGQDARQTQNYAGAYNPTGMMYNVQQASAQTPVYDTSQQFSSRPPAGMQMMTADVTSPYFQSEPTNAAATSGLQPQTASSSTGSAVYQQSPADRSALLQGYSGGMATMAGHATQTQSTGTDIAMDDTEYPASGGLDEAYASYQTALKEVFRNVRHGILATASASLLDVSDWLISHVTELGLTTDDKSLHPDRIKLWTDFNRAWLAMLQKQKDMWESDQLQQRSQTFISRENLEKMGKELVRLCDSVERHGLVDYEYGVWETQIISILTECLDLYDSGGGSSRNAGSSSSRRG